MVPTVPAIPAGHHPSLLLASPPQSSHILTTSSQSGARPSQSDRVSTVSVSAERAGHHHHHHHNTSQRSILTRHTTSLAQHSHTVTAAGGPRRLPVDQERERERERLRPGQCSRQHRHCVTPGQQMTAEKEPSNMYKSKSGGAPSDGQAREK